ncbi:cuticle protein 7-like [Anthonomus grandis grandis]|uniref:cuticle protein 7-like n=1 Tax=Anthonomus grandis grandis TaxID=2921223 RepID=UPI002166A559|nr:cuticle protein 7-like [Anthonomus grandis grandis]
MSVELRASFSVKNIIMFVKKSCLLIATISLVSATGVINLGHYGGYGLGAGLGAGVGAGLGAGLGAYGAAGLGAGLENGGGNYGHGVAIGHVAEQVVSSIPVVQTRVEPYDHNPIYGYSYTVHDSHTGDSKHQIETRHGDSVRGEYSLAEPDGSRRTVHYASEPHTGFNAVVHRSHH